MQASALFTCAWPPVASGIGGALAAAIDPPAESPAANDEINAVSEVLS